MKNSGEKVRNRDWGVKEDKKVKTKSGLRYGNEIEVMAGGREAKLIIAYTLMIVAILVVLSSNPDIRNFAGKVIDEFQDFLGINAVTIVNVTANFSKQVGEIRSDFYGVNTHAFWLGSGTEIDTNGDGSLESDSNLSWHRAAFLDSGMGAIRWDANLENYYSDGNFSRDFESWNDANVGYVVSDSSTGTAGWRISPYNGGAGFISRSTDAHLGSYSLNVTTNQSSYLYLYEIIDLNEDGNYNFSAWIKGTGSFSI